jgi:hypothetical protein
MLLKDCQCSALVGFVMGWQLNRDASIRYSLDAAQHAS